MENDSEQMQQVLIQYVNKNYTLKEMKVLLDEEQNIKLSTSALKDKLRRYGLGTRRYDDNWAAIIPIIESENARDPKCGYRQMTLRLRLHHNIYVRRSDVMEIMRAIDPVGTHLRRARRLTRRVYAVAGPNQIWHIDGHDKLKPFGLAIHGAIDGYSRKIIWLRACPSNNDPCVVAHFFREAVITLQKSPQILRTDRGTENVNAGAIAEFIGSTHIYGSSTTNQRIEALWSVLLYRGGLLQWRSHLKQLANTHHFNGSDVEIRCIRKCYMKLLQAELDRFTEYWNCHFISGVGKPDILYASGQDCAVALTNRALLDDPTVLQATAYQSTLTGALETDDYFNYLWDNFRLAEPSTLIEAQQTYEIIKPTAMQQ